MSDLKKVIENFDPKQALDSKTRNEIKRKFCDFSIKLKNENELKLSNEIKEILSKGHIDIKSKILVKEKAEELITINGITRINNCNIKLIDKITIKRKTYFTLSIFRKSFI